MKGDKKTKRKTRDKKKRIMIHFRNRTNCRTDFDYSQNFRGSLNKKLKLNEMVFIEKQNSNRTVFLDIINSDYYLIVYDKKYKCFVTIIEENKINDHQFILIEKALNRKGLSNTHRQIINNLLDKRRLKNDI